MSRLKKWNLLSDNWMSGLYRKCRVEFEIYYHVSCIQCFCKDVIGLIPTDGVKHNTAEYLLFIDSSTSLEINIHLCLLHVPYRRKKPIIMFLVKIFHEYFQFDICGDFTMLVFFHDLQGEYAKYSCFLFLWESRADDEHY